MSRKKSFRKSLRESFRRLRRGRSQRQQATTTGQVTTGRAAITGVSSASAADHSSSTTTASSGVAVKPAFSRVTTGVRALNAPSAVSNDSNAPGGASPMPRNVYSNERQVEPKVELSSIIRCITLTSAVITSNASFRPTLWVGTNSGQVLVYAIELASEQQRSASVEVSSSVVAESSTTTAIADKDVSSGNVVSEDQVNNSSAEPPILTTARLAKEIQLKHKAPIIAIFTSPDAPAAVQQPVNDVTLDSSIKSTPEKQASGLLSEGSVDKSDKGDVTSEVAPTIDSVAMSERSQTPASVVAVEVAVNKSSNSKQQQQSNKDKESHLQARVLICSEEQFKVFNLPNLKPFCKFKLTANEGLRAKKISITQFLKPVSNKLQQQQSSLSSTTQQQAAISASRSLQSFATQTSRPASPIPPTSAVEGAHQADNSSNSANGATGKQESNNNSLAALNNNHTTNSSSSSKQDSKELMNAKFGAKSAGITTQTEKDSHDGGAQLQQQALLDGANLFEPYMVCMSNQGDCAIYSVPDLKRQASIQVCKREDVNGITSTMLTNYGEGYYLKSSSNFLRFSISTQRVLRVLSVV